VRPSAPPTSRETAATNAFSGLAPHPDGFNDMDAAATTAELTVVVPCRNEAENVPVMVERLG